MDSIITLENNATVLAATLVSDVVDGKWDGMWSSGAVLAKLTDRDWDEYVVWEVERHVLNSPKWQARSGHYTRNLTAAKDEYARRCVAYIPST